MASGSLGLDASVLVALSCDWHVAHAPVRTAIERAEKRGQRLVVPAAALVETYSVLTRLPPPRRMRPSMASDLLRHNLESAALEALEREAVWPLIDAAVEVNVAGGAIYDRVIAATLLSKGTATVLTLNPRHFAGVDGLTVLVPQLD